MTCVDFGLDALPAASAAAPMFYSLVLKPGVDPAVARASLLRASGNRLDVQVAVNPAARLGVVRVVIVVAVLVLVLIAMANLLTATDVGLRDHVHEAGILKAMGLTPRQVMATLVVSTTIVTAIGIVAGVAAGLAVAPRLINLQGQASGMGWGIAAGLSLADDRRPAGRRPRVRRRGGALPRRPRRPRPGSRAVRPCRRPERGLRHPLLTARLLGPLVPASNTSQPE